MWRLGIFTTGCFKCWPIKTWRYLGLVGRLNLKMFESIHVKKFWNWLADLDMFDPFSDWLQSFALFEHRTSESILECPLEMVVYLKNENKTTPTCGIGDDWEIHLSYICFDMKGPYQKGNWSNACDPPNIWYVQGRLGMRSHSELVRFITMKNLLLICFLVWLNVLHMPMKGRGPEDVTPAGFRLISWFTNWIRSVLICTEWCNPMCVGKWSTLGDFCLFDPFDREYS